MSFCHIEKIAPSEKQKETEKEKEKEVKQGEQQGEQQEEQGEQGEQGEQQEEQKEEQQEEQKEVEIDWQLEEGQINSYRLNDAEVREALGLLEEAKKWVSVNSQEVTQRIRLIGKDGSVLYVIRCNNGRPDTKDIKISEVKSVFSIFSEITKYSKHIFVLEWISIINQFLLNWIKSCMKLFGI